MSTTRDIGPSRPRTRRPPPRTPACRSSRGTPARRSSPGTPARRSSRCETPTDCRGGPRTTTTPRGPLRRRWEPPNAGRSAATPADRTRARRRSGAGARAIARRRPRTDTGAIESRRPGDQGARARVRRHRGRLRRVLVVVARGPRARGELSEHVRSLRTGARPGASSSAERGGAGRRRAGAGTAKARTPGGAGLRARRPGGQVRVRARPPERVT